MIAKSLSIKFVSYRTPPNKACGRTFALSRPTSNTTSIKTQSARLQYFCVPIAANAANASR